jgi:hypothetical protein
MSTDDRGWLARRVCVTALILVALVAATAGASSATTAAPVPDPERNATTPTSWHFWVARSKEAIDQLAKNAGERVVDVSVDSAIPLRFSAVLVQNTGIHARTGGWSYGSEADVTSAIKANQGRLIDLEPYTVNGQRRFAFVWVRNTGDAGKAWYWNYDLTVEQVVAAINKYKIRLVDLASYVVGGQRRYSYVGIVNQGVDARAWWWYVNVTPQFVQQKAQEHRARLIDVERPSAGLMTVIMQRNDEKAYSRHVYDYTLTDLLRFQASNGIRITDLEAYVKNGQPRYAASLLDNATAENRRIRSIWRSSTMANAPNGTDAWFGIYAKEVKGPVDVGLAHTSPYQPLSVLKLVPHLYVMDLLDKDPGIDLLDQRNGISWTALKGKPDEIYCAHDPNHQGQATQAYSETLRKTLTRGLGESLNRAHEALVNKYGFAAINNRIHGLGLTGTDVYPGCPQPSGQRDWTSNRTTLRELGELFERVDTKSYFPNHWQEVSGEFYGLMADGSLNGIQNVVVNEAAKAGKSGIVSAFMAKVTLNGKGGGTQIQQSDGTWQGGRGYFGRITLPFRGRFGVTAIRTFVGGYFVDSFAYPCDEDTAASSKSGTCRSWKKKQNATYDQLGGEPYRLAIRRAIATWPSS